MSFDSGRIDTGIVPDIDTPEAQGEHVVEQRHDPGLTAGASLAHANLDSMDVQRQVMALIEQAGFERGDDGAMVIRDSVHVGATTTSQSISGLKDFESVSGVSDTKLKPPSPPMPKLEAEQIQALDSFANDIDIAVNEFVLTPTALAALNSPSIKTDGAVQFAAVASASQHTEINAQHHANTIIVPTATTSQGGSTQNQTGVFDPTQPVAGLGYRLPKELTADILLAIFLKLQVTDPNNSVETHNKLYEMATNMRQMAIEEAQQKIKNAAEQMKEAQAYASQAEAYSSMMGMVSTLLSIASLMTMMGPALMAAQNAIRETVTTAMKEAMTTALNELKNQTLQQAKDQIVNELPQQITDQVMEQLKNTSQDVIQDYVQKYGQEAGQKLAEDITTEVAKQFSETMGPELTKKFGEEATKQITDEFTKNVADQVSKKLVETFPEQLGKQAIDAGKVSEVALNNVNKTPTQRAMDFMQNLKGDKKLSLAKGAISAGGQAGGAVAQAKAAQKMADAQLMMLGARRLQMLAEMFQQMIEEENEIMKIIMESKNATVDAVMKMMNAAFVVNQKLMSAGMAK